MAEQGFSYIVMARYVFIIPFLFSIGFSSFAQEVELGFASPSFSNFSYADTMNKQLAHIVGLDLSLPQETLNRLKQNLYSERTENMIAEIQEYLLKNQGEISIPLNYDHLDKKEREVLTAVRNLSFMGLVFFAVLWHMPEDFTGWDTSKGFGEILDGWHENIKSDPVVDTNHWTVNYIGHPMSGAYEYLFLRNQNFSKLESFGFAVFASTVLWEYGIEATTRVPSIQDLIITPVFGSILGEYFHKWDQQLKHNDYVLWDSRTFGRFIHHIINPVEGVNDVLNKLFRSPLLKLDQLRFYVDSNELTKEDYEPFRSSVGFKFEIVF